GAADRRDSHGVLARDKIRRGNAVGKRRIVAAIGADGEAAGIRLARSAGVSQRMTVDNDGGASVVVSAGRPSVVINGHALTNPGASSQPNSRSFTIGTYRGNNTTFTYSIPAADFVTGQNTMTISPISGSSDL